jgi:creatinine amidohydrolase
MREATMKLCEKTWPQIEEYLQNKTTILLPIGATEQHGPTGLIGTDFINAQSLAEKLGEDTQTLVAPTLSYGMSQHHLAFPGTCSLKPKTLELVLTDIFESLILHGFQRVLVINGHGGNIESYEAANKAVSTHQSFVSRIHSWWRGASVQAYQDEVFGQRDGQHATAGEISMTMMSHPHAIQKHQGTLPYNANRPTHWPLTKEEFKEQFSDGRIGSDPCLATAEHGKHLFELALKDCCQELKIIEETPL